VEVSRSYNKNNFASFLRHGVLIELFARLLKVSEFHYFNRTVLWYGSVEGPRGK